VTLVRDALPDDLEAVMALAEPFVTSFTIDKSVFNKSYLQLLASPNAHLSVAELESKVIGYVLGFEHLTFYANGHVGWVEEIYVNETARMLGVGKLLMQHFEQWCATRECKLIALATRRAASFYQALEYVDSAVYFRKLL